MTSYDPNIPEDLPPGNIIVDQIRSNFSQFATIFANNHSALNSSNQGKHTNVLLQQQLAPPVVNGNFNSLYCKPVLSNSSISEQLFVRIPQFLPPEFPNNPMQLTFNSVNIGGPVYQSFMAGGYIIYFGTVAAVPATITLSPKPSLILCAIANVNDFPSFPVNAAVLVNLNNFQFTISSGNPGAYRVSWLAIGKA